jgi:parvulin-like peptidyl-prolyl isomerase
MPTRVNGELLKEEEVQAEEQAIMPRLAEAMRGESRKAILDRAREWSRENVIDRVLLRQAAEREGIDVETLTERITAKLAKPKATELTDYYRRNASQFYAPDRIRASHIVCDIDEKTSEEQARTLIESAAAQLAAGEDFGAVADSMSSCPGNGGDLGFFPRGEMVPEFDEVAFRLAVGQVSPVFRTPFGYHIVRVSDAREGGVRKFDEVRDIIAHVLLSEKKQRAVDRFVDRFRASSAIEHT